MRKLIFIALCALALLSCNKLSKEINTYNATRIIAEVKDTVYMSKADFEAVQKLSTAAKDVAIYFLTNRDKWIAGDHTFRCGKYEIWVANGYSHVEIWRPVEYEFNATEKKFFWNLYMTYQREDMRLYKYEDKIEILIK